MERLTVRCDFGLKEEVEQIGYNLPNVEEMGFYSIYDLAKYAEDDVVLKEMLGRISLKLAEYEDTGMTPDEIHKLNDFEQSQIATLLKEKAILLKEHFELKKERNYWEREAKRWASELGEQKIERGKNERS